MVMKGDLQINFRR